MATLENEPDFVDELVQLLVSANARAKISPARLARSTLYDPDYHTAMIACAMRVHGVGPKQSILAPWLKLLQFLAARPALVERFIGYAAGRQKGTLEPWERLPHGYLGDDTHETVIDLLVASGVLKRSGDAIEGGTRFSLLEKVGAYIETERIFSAERAILERLRPMRVTKVLLGAS